MDKLKQIEDEFKAKRATEEKLAAQCRKIAHDKILRNEFGSLLDEGLVEWIDYTLSKPVIKFKDHEPIMVDYHHVMSNPSRVKFRYGDKNNNHEAWSLGEVLVKTRIKNKDKAEKKGWFRWRKNRTK